MHDRIAILKGPWTLIDGTNDLLGSRGSINQVRAAHEIEYFRVEVTLVHECHQAHHLRYKQRWRRGNYQLRWGLSVPAVT